MNPFSVKTLAERWNCSQGHVRGLVKSGKLRSFSLGGKLVRISAEEVEKWENQSTGLPESTDAISSSGTKEAADNAVRLARMIKDRPRPVLVSFNGNTGSK